MEPSDRDIVNVDITEIEKQRGDAESKFCSSFVTRKRVSSVELRAANATRMEAEIRSLKLDVICLHNDRIKTREMVLDLELGMRSMYAHARSAQGSQRVLASAVHRLASWQRNISDSMLYSVTPSLHHACMQVVRTTTRANSTPMALNTVAVVASEGARLIAADASSAIPHISETNTTVDFSGIPASLQQGQQSRHGLPLPFAAIGSTRAPLGWPDEEHEGDDLEGLLAAGATRDRHGRGGEFHGDDVGGDGYPSSDALRHAVASNGHRHGSRSNPAARPMHTGGDNRDTESAPAEGDMIQRAVAGLAAWKPRVEVAVGIYMGDDPVPRFHVVIPTGSAVSALRDCIQSKIERIYGVATAAAAADAPILARVARSARGPTVGLSGVDCTASSTRSASLPVNVTHPRGTLLDQGGRQMRGASQRGLRQHHQTDTFPDDGNGVWYRPFQLGDSVNTYTSQMGVSIAMAPAEQGYSVPRSADFAHRADSDSLYFQDVNVEPESTGLVDFIAMNGTPPQSAPSVHGRERQGRILS